MKKYKKAILSALLLSLMIVQFSVAQEQDAGLWLTASIEKKISKDFKATLSQEFRFKENYSQLGTYFTDIGLQYKISKSLNASFNYRFIEKLQKDLTYDTRSRFYLDVAYRYKADKWNFILRTRFQDQIESFSTDEDYSQPQFYWRNKLTIKYSLKDFTPYATAEVFYPLNNPKGNIIDEFRLSAGSDYEINKKNSVGGYFLIDKEINVKNPVTSFIIGLEYGFAF
jgi:hypothetical protein